MFWDKISEKIGNWERSLSFGNVPSVDFAKKTQDEQIVNIVLTH